MLNNEEEVIGQLFREQLHQAQNEDGFQNSGADEKIENSIKIANHQTGTRDLIALFLAGTFTFFIALLAPLSTKIIRSNNK